MKMRTLRILSLMTAGILCISALSGCGSDPTVRQTEETKENYQVATEATGDEAENIYKFTAYPSGKTDPVTFKDVEVDVNAFALRSHELAYMIGETKFDSPDELSVDAATQFGFTHIFYEDFYKIDNRAVAFRTVKSEQIEEQLEKYFGKNSIDPEKSILYNPKTKKLEMWLPEYGTNMYYNIDAVQEEGDALEITTTFYREKAKSTITEKFLINATRPITSYLRNKNKQKIYFIKYK